MPKQSTSLNHLIARYKDFHPGFWKPGVREHPAPVTLNVTILEKFAEQNETLFRPSDSQRNRWKINGPVLKELSEKAYRLNRLIELAKALKQQGLSDDSNDLE